MAHYKYIEKQIKKRKRRSVEAASLAAKKFRPRVKPSKKTYRRNKVFDTRDTP